MARIGHVSDLHFLDVRNTKPWHYANKRLIGGTNLLVNRKKKHRDQIAQTALAQLDTELQVDHIAISGDMTNLALPSEFAAAARFVGVIGDAKNRVSIVPGNHDYYTADAEKEGRFENQFGCYLKSDVPEHQLPSSYPYCKFIGDSVALIGLNSGIATLPLMATGEVREEELAALDRLLADPKLTDKFVIVMVHHHLVPYEHAKLEKLRQLINADDVQRVLRDHGVGLAIHGHNHHNTYHALPHRNGDGTLHVVGCSSTSIGVHHHIEAKSGTFNIYDFDGAELKKIETYIFRDDSQRFEFWTERVFN